jgi:predicted PurR-regulated permease PerM
MKKIFYKPFLIFLIVLCLVGIFFLFRPFLMEIIIAAVLVSVFYSWYEKLVKILWGRRYLSSFVMCLLLLLIIIIPLTNLIVYAGKKATVAYNSVNEIVEQADSLQYDVLERLNIEGFDENIVGDLVVDITKKINDWLVDGATDIVKGTTSFVLSLLIIILTMLFFFVDGRKMAKKLIELSPLPNKYDLEIVRKFRKVSQVTLASIFVTALAQGLSGGLGFYIIGWPFIFTFIITGFLSLIPFLGASIFYFPVAIYLVLSGQIWEAIFILLWWWIVVNGVDEVLRAYIIKGRAQVNFIFVIFAVLGGIAWFGFWGVVVGPLIVALAVTIFHIYELEYKDELSDNE